MAFKIALGLAAGAAVVAAGILLLPQKTTAPAEPEIDNIQTSKACSGDVCVWQEGGKCYASNPQNKNDYEVVCSRILIWFPPILPGEKQAVLRKLILNNGGMIEEEQNLTGLELVLWKIKVAAPSRMPIFYNSVFRNRPSPEIRLEFDGVANIL